MNVTATTLSVTWSAGYPKCYSFTVSHSTQDGSINVTQPANSDTSHTLTSLQPGTTYRIEVEAVRKGDRANGQREKVMAKFPTATASECLQWDAFRYRRAFSHSHLYSPPPWTFIKHYIIYIKLLATCPLLFLETLEISKCSTATYTTMEDNLHSCNSTFHNLFVSPVQHHVHRPQ